VDVYRWGVDRPFTLAREDSVHRIREEKLSRNSLGSHLAVPKKLFSFMSLLTLACSKALQKEEDEGRRTIK